LSARGAGSFVVADASDARDVELLAVRAGAAAGGTLFVDEIDRLTAAQVDELLGLAPPDARIIAATRKELTLERFLALHVPPLRDRREDILPLARRALAFFCQGTPVPKAELTLEAENALLAYGWPGNVRELCDAMERAVILRSGVRVGTDALPEAIASGRAVGPYLGGEFTIDAIEREHIFRVLASASSIDEASRTLGIDASTLWRKRKRYDE
jgi:NtrC-family two-component system response regulator AlgB